VQFGKRNPSFDLLMIYAQMRRLVKRRNCQVHKKIARTNQKHGKQNLGTCSSHTHYHDFKTVL